MAMREATTGQGSLSSRCPADKVRKDAHSESCIILHNPACSKIYKLRLSSSACNTGVSPFIDFPKAIEENNKAHPDTTVKAAGPGIPFSVRVAIREHK